jgi:hypothetical protein
MNRETKFLRLKTPAMLGERVNGWRVCWLGGWDRNPLFYVVMVKKRCGAMAAAVWSRPNRILLFALPGDSVL